MTRKAHLPSQAASLKAETITKTLALGRSHHNQGHLKLAEGCYRQVLALDPSNVEGLHLLGVVALQSSNGEEAVRFIKRAASKRPGDFSILVNLGAAYRAAGKNAEAVKTYKAAIRLNPKSHDVHFNLGRALTELGELDAAIESYKKSIALNPRDPDAYINLGNTHKYKGDGDNAIAAYEQALKIAPMAQAYSNIAAVYVDRTRFADAYELMNKAVALDPQPGELRFKRSLIALRLTEFETGWSDYESRFVADKERIARCPVPPAYWNGEDLKGKTLLISTEQGLGDEILYAGMLSEVFPVAGHCIVECSPRMVPVFKRSFPQATVVRYQRQGIPTTAPAGIDFQTTIGSLGRYFRPSLDRFPRHKGYLKADAERVAALRARYQAVKPGQLIVGLSWRSKNDTVGAAKSTDLLAWADILKIPGVTFVNLQYGDCRAELDAVKQGLGVEVFQDPEVDPLKNMDDCFAQVAAMDLVITTSNTTVHVAGSLNIPAWLMLTAGPACLWYWFLNRADTPWYPSVDVFRRERSDSNEKGTEPWWQESMASIARALVQRMRGTAADKQNE